MKHYNCIFFLTILSLLTASYVSCKPDLKANEFNIYVSEDDPGWHLIDLNYDTIHTGFHRIIVKFDKGQKFQQVLIRSDLKNYQPTFLFNNGDTERTELWFRGEFTYDTKDSLQRNFLIFYMPNEVQRKTIKDYMEDPSYDSLRYELGTVVENYLLKRGKLK